LRWKPSLITTMPAGYSVVWPYYLGDLRVTVHASNRIETGRDKPPVIVGDDPDEHRSGVPIDLDHLVLVCKGVDRAQ